MFRTPEVGCIEILGELVSIVISELKCKEFEAAGLYTEGKIYLLPYYETEKEYNRVIFHESFHALVDHLGCQLDHNLEETLAHRVSIMYADEFTR